MGSPPGKLRGPVAQLGARVGTLLYQEKLKTGS